MYKGHMDKAKWGKMAGVVGVTEGKWRQLYLNNNKKKKKHLERTKDGGKVGGI